MNILRILGWFAFGMFALVAIVTEVKKRQEPVVLPGYVGGQPNEKHDPWTYDVSTDAMSGKIDRQARIASSNAFELKPPYQGEQHAIVVLRQSPRLGKDIILQVSRGQLICEYRACKVTVRFDDAAPVEWPASHATDNNTTTLFLGEYDHFIARVNDSKRLRIEATFYQDGSHVLEFPIAHFDRAKYEGNK